ncbi:MAG: hypothetical protein ACW99F_12300 [Candidatus Hodarchaeales archaeon]
MTTLNQKSLNSKQLEELRCYFKQHRNDPNHVLNTKWKVIKHMQSDLGLDPNLSTKELTNLFLRLEEIKTIFKLKSVTFMQLERILVEIETVKDMLDIPRNTPLEEVIAEISPYDIPNLGVGNNSNLERIMKYF